MAEDRFANTFSAIVTLSAANTLTYAEMNFGITLRDRVAIVIDELYFIIAQGALTEMTTLGDNCQMAISVSDQPTNLMDYADRRILYSTRVSRQDFGTAAGGQFFRVPVKESFAPPLIALPNRLFFGATSVGLASAQQFQLRMHFRTVSITQDQQLVEVLEAFQLST